MTYYHISEKSANKKTGGIIVTTSSRKTCPSNCPFKNGGGCYAYGGPLRLHWDKVTSGERGIEFKEFVSRLKESKCNKIRLWQAGDMPGADNKINVNEVKQLVKAVAGRDAWTYTHKPLSYGKNKDIIKYCNDNGLAVNLSGNNLSHTDELLDLQIAPVCVTLPIDQKEFGKAIRTPKGRPVIICPAALNKDKFTCSTCGGKGKPLCARIDRPYVIGFPAHGNSKKKVDKIARSQ